MFSCKRCSSSDPTSDTIKLDMSKLNAQVEQRREAEAQAAERRKAEEAEAHRRAEEQEHKRRELEAAESAAVLAAEERRGEQEAERLRLQQEQEERERQAAEQAERRRQVAEEQRQREAEDKENRGRLDSWLRQEKFEGVNHKRQSMMKAKYPLHSAIKRQDMHMVQLLLRYNADPTLKDSNNQTPGQLAVGSILQALA